MLHIFPLWTPQKNGGGVGRFGAKNDPPPSAWPVAGLENDPLLTFPRRAAKLRGGSRPPPLPASVIPEFYGNLLKENTAILSNFN